MTSLSPAPLRVRAAAAALLLIAGCSADRMPTGLEPELPPGLDGIAFHLTIDVASGAVTVHPPRSSLPPGASASLLGSDVVELHTTNCVWTSLPPNAKQRRCTFDLAIRNILASTDLLTPTAFPQPPAGTDGILVFPFAAAALGVPGGTATPSPDWDNEPANFFNDFGGCGNKASDCYRSETYAAPLYGGDMSEYRTVGFDVDRNAQSVSVYIVVAADLRDNPVHEVTLAPGNAQCGSVGRSNIEGDVFYMLLDELSAAFWQDNTAIRQQLSFCGFDLPSGIGGASVVLATLRMHQHDAGGSPFPAVVDHADFGAELDVTDFHGTALVEDIGTIADDFTVGYRMLDVTAAVQDDVSSGRIRSQFRVRLASPAPDSYVSFTHLPPDQPELVLVWRRH